MSELREGVSKAVCSQCYEKGTDCLRLKKYEWCKKPGYWNYAMTSAVLAAVVEAVEGMPLEAPYYRQDISQYGWEKIVKEERANIVALLKGKEG